VAQVLDAVRSWREEFSRAGISETDISRFKVIDANCALE